MIKKGVIGLSIFGVIFWGSLWFNNLQAQETPELELTSFPFKRGEVITYVIKNLGIKSGEATLTFQGLTQLNNRDVYLIIFRADGLNFYDEEKIYTDPKTFFPILIKRDLNIFGKKEKIEEHYETQKGIVRIVKTRGERTTEQIIEKEGNIDNIYCFIYRVRRDGQFTIGDEFFVRLPTKDINMKIIKQMPLKAAGQKYDSFYFKSNPKQYQVWFDTGSQKIPLRISGSMGIKATTMTMVKYQGSTN